MNEALLLKHSQKAIGKGSKSFAMASLFFGEEVKNGAHLLYCWCRYVDDYIDHSPADELESRLNFLKAETKKAIAGEPSDILAFQALALITSKHGIPAHYPLEMIEGMQMDVLGYKYENFEDLKLYCYRVASTVGLMMCHIMGISDEKALRHASDMGMAMQMTNISRDIAEDFKNGRVYLPESWLESENIEPQNLMVRAQRSSVFRVVERLLNEAETFYRSGDAGLRYLNFRARWAVSAARWIYSQIGHRILKRGPIALESRTIIPKWKKLWLAAKTLFQLGRHKWQPVAIQKVWRHV